MKVSVIVDCTKSSLNQSNLLLSRSIEYVELTKNKSLSNVINECKYDWVLIIDAKDKVINNFEYINDFDPDIQVISFNGIYNSFEGLKPSNNLQRGYHYNITPEFGFSIFKKDFLLKCKFEDNKPVPQNVYKTFFVERFYIVKFQEAFPIDFVFPYVDGDDRKWQRIFKAYEADAYKASKEYANYNVESNFSSGKQRFVDRDMLKYLFRSIDFNLPFIRTVHMIVMCNTQIPYWLNTEKLHVVYHNQFIPEKYLPTFNSNTIEMFLHKIPGLSEHFIYSNDDMYIAKKQPISLWFRDGLPGLWHENIPNDFRFTGDYCRGQNYKVITQDETARQFKVQHGMFPMLKSVNEECFELHKDEILNSISRFREKKNLNQWLWTNYAIHTGRYFRKRRRTYCRVMNDESRKDIYEADFSKYTCLCLNDGGVQQTDEDTIVLHEKMDKLFPNKSKFEK